MVNAWWDLLLQRLNHVDVKRRGGILMLLHLCLCKLRDTWIGAVGYWQAALPAPSLYGPFELLHDGFVARQHLDVPEKLRHL